MHEYLVLFSDFHSRSRRSIYGGGCQLESTVRCTLVGFHSKGRPTNGPAQHHALQNHRVHACSAASRYKPPLPVFCLCVQPRSVAKGSLWQVITWPVRVDLGQFG